MTYLAPSPVPKDGAISGTFPGGEAKYTYYYFATDLKAGAIGSLYNVAADPRLNHEVRITHGVLADESTALLQAFFADRR